MKSVEEPMSDKSSLAGNHVTKLSETEVLSAQSQQLAAAHAHYAHAMQCAAAQAQTHRRLLNGQHNVMLTSRSDIHLNSVRLYTQSKSRSLELELKATHAYHK